MEADQMWPVIQLFLILLAPYIVMTLVLEILDRVTS